MEKSALFYNLLSDHVKGALCPYELKMKALLSKPRKYLLSLWNVPEERRLKDAEKETEGLKLFAFKILPLRDFNLKN
jgi:hypothetical protein